MNVNYFLTILGEILQRMEDPYAKYSIALPDIQQFRNLWDRLPLLAKVRTGITALFVDENGEATEVYLNQLLNKMTLFLSIIFFGLQDSQLRFINNYSNKK